MSPIRRPLIVLALLALGLSSCTPATIATGGATPSASAGPSTQKKQKSRRERGGPTRGPRSRSGR